ncbi:streptophobe family protein [Geodermatophilus sp. SYSU D00710]
MPARFCSACGAAVVPGAQFCAACGARVGEPLPAALHVVPGSDAPPSPPPSTPSGHPAEPPAQPAPPPYSWTPPAGPPVGGYGAPSGTPWGTGASGSGSRSGKSIADGFGAGDWPGALAAAAAAVGVMTGVALIGMLIVTEVGAGFRGTFALVLAAVCSAVGGDPYLSASAADAAEGSISLGLLPLNVTFAGLGTLGWAFTLRLRASSTTALRDVLVQAARTVLAFTALFLPLSLLTRYRSDDGAALNLVGQFGVSVWSSLLGAFLFAVATLGLASLLSRRTVLPPRLQRVREAVRAPLGGAACVLATGGVVLAVTLLLGLLQQDERLALLGGATLGAGNGVLAGVLWSGGVPLTMEGGLATSVLGGFQRTASQSIDLTTITDVSAWFWLAPVVLLVVALVVAMALAVRQDSVPDARREGLRFAAALAAIAFAAALLLRISVSSEGSAAGATGSAGGTATFNPFLAGFVFAVWGAVAGLLAPVLATHAPVGFVSFVRRRFGTADALARGYAGPSPVGGTHPPAHGTPPPNAPPSTSPQWRPYEPPPV